MTRKAGIGSHQSAENMTETWLTPKFVLDELGPFDLDPCAAPEPRPWPTAKEHYTLPLQNGLLLPWNGRVFLNPPYSRRLDAFMRRMGEHGQGTALIFARTETQIFHEEIWPKADAMLFLRGRLTFCRPDGTPAEANGGAPSVLIAYGEEDVERLAQCKLDGQFVPLSRPVMIAVALNSLGTVPGDESWADIIRNAVGSRTTVSLSELYERISGHRKTSGNPFWREKIRQTLGRIGAVRVGPAQYSLAI
ncbi:MAG: phage N-6-adenine-methyltransferase [Phreatobacter sp.]|nr:phage N-6-adenine-methyltransferase [Phreatobacter sp.]